MMPVTSGTAMRDGLEALFVVAVGGMLWSAVGKLRRREIVPVICEQCGRPTSNAYDVCKHCRAPRP